MQQAVDLLGSGGTVLAGGQSLVAQMAFRRTRPELLVDINDVPELDGYSFPGGGPGVTGSDRHALQVGATCRQELLASWRPVDPAWNAIPQAVGAIGNHVIRSRGTVGGSIAYADPAGELPTMFLLFDGELTARSASGERVLESSRLFVGPNETALLADELITALRLNAPPPGAITAFRELSERTAVAGVGVGLAAADGRCTWCRVVMCGVASTPIRALEGEQRLVGSALTASDIEDAAGLAAGSASPVSDSHGSAGFRRALVASLVRRNLNDISCELKARTR